MVYTLSNVEKKKKDGYYFVAHESYVKFKFQCPSLKLYWITDTFIYVLSIKLM